MNIWFEGLSVLEKVYFFIALPASVFLLIQTIMFFVGLGAGSGDLDSLPGSDTSGLDADGGGCDDCGDSHGDDNLDGGVRVVTLRGLIAFFTVGGWAGFAFAGSEMHISLVITLSLIFGTAMLFLVAYLFKWAFRLQEDGTIKLSNAVGRTGEVYLPIGAANTKTGKIAIEVQGRYIEMDAITRGDKSLSVGTPVKVVDMLTDTIAVVEQLIS